MTFEINKCYDESTKLKFNSKLEIRLNKQWSVITRIAMDSETELLEKWSTEKTSRRQSMIVKPLSSSKLHQSSERTDDKHDYLLVRNSLSSKPRPTLEKAFDQAAKQKNMVTTGRGIFPRVNENYRTHGKEVMEDDDLAMTAIGVIEQTEAKKDMAKERNFNLQKNREKESTVYGLILFVTFPAFFFHLVR